MRLFFQDEARIGQNGRTDHVWWRRGERPRGIAEKRFIFADDEPESDNAFTLILPYVNTEAMQLFLDRFSATLEPTSMSRWCSTRPAGTVRNALAHPWWLPPQDVA